MTQEERAEVFRALHVLQGAFIMPNPWDAGTAKILAGVGFEALATTSAGHAFSLGQQDGAAGHDDLLAHVGRIVAATDLPVSADLGNGFGDSPEAVARTIQLAAAAGAVGGSIEDATGRPDEPIYEEALAIERVQAAAEAARQLPFHFTLTARCDNFLYDVHDLDATIRRLQAYEQAGTDVLYAPGLINREQVTAVVASVERPLNVLMGAKDCPFDRAELSAMGVKRISVGSALSRCALGAVVRAAREMREDGRFTFGNEAISYQEAMKLFAS